MFEFFIALFGFLFYGGKLASENAQTKAIKRREAKRKALNDEIESKVVASQETENKIKDRMECGEYKDEILDELREDFEFIYGTEKSIEELLRFLPDAPPSDPRFKHRVRRCGAENVAFHLLLAHIGKVNVWKYYDGFLLGGDDKSVEIDTRFCQRIEHHLNENGIDVKLYMKPDLMHNWDSAWTPYWKRVVFEHKLFEGNGKRLW